MSDKIDGQLNGKIRLPNFGLGTAPLGDQFSILPEGDADALLSATWERGIRYYDTSPFYGMGQAELRVGRMLKHKPRDSFRLSTKVGRVIRKPADRLNRELSIWSGGLPFEFDFDYSYDGIMRSVEQSMIRLGLNKLDLLVIHDLDPLFHSDEASLTQHIKTLSTSGIKALQELRSTGEITGFGAGINRAFMIPQILDAADLDFLLLATPYTLLSTEAAENELMLCNGTDIEFVIGSPFASGILATGAVEGAMYNYEPASEEILKRVREIEAVCRDFDVPIQAAALQFPLGHPRAVSVISGCVNADQAKANMEWMASSIPTEFWRSLIGKGLLHESVPYPGRTKE